MKPYKSLNTTPKAPAYWISPDNEVYPLFGERKHIDLLIEQPEMFGLSLGYILRCYEEKNEELGCEGIAREKLIKECIKKGWIRIRYYPRNDCFTVNILEYNESSSKRLAVWASAMMEYGYEFSNVKVDMANGSEMRTVVTLTEQA